MTHHKIMDHDKAVYDAAAHFRGTKRYDGPVTAAAGYHEAIRAARMQLLGPSVNPGLTQAQVERFYDARACEAARELW